MFQKCFKKHDVSFETFFETNFIVQKNPNPLFLVKIEN